MKWFNSNSTSVNLCNQRTDTPLLCIFAVNILSISKPLKNKINFFSRSN